MTLPNRSSRWLAQSKEIFRVSAARLRGAHHFQLYADVLGSDQRVVTRPIQVQGGGTTVWSLEASSTLSTIKHFLDEPRRQERLSPPCN